MPSQKKPRLSVHNTIKTGNIVIKCLQLDAYTQNTTLKIEKWQ